MNTDYAPSCKAYVGDNKPPIEAPISTCSSVRKLLYRILLMAVCGSCLLLTGFLACYKKSNTSPEVVPPAGKFIPYTFPRYVGSITILDRANPVCWSIVSSAPFYKKDIKDKKDISRQSLLRLCLHDKESIDFGNVGDWRAIAAEYFSNIPFKQHAIDPNAKSKWASSFMVCQRTSSGDKHTFSLDLGDMKLQSGEQVGFLLVKDGYSPVDLVKHLIETSEPWPDQSQVCIKYYLILPGQIRKSLLQSEYACDSLIDLNSYSKPYCYIKKEDHYCFIPLENHLLEDRMSYATSIQCANGVSKTMQTDIPQSRTIGEGEPSDNMQKQANETFCSQNVQSEINQPSNQEVSLLKTTPKRSNNGANQYIDLPSSQCNTYHSTPKQGIILPALKPPNELVQDEERGSLREENSENVELLAMHFEGKNAQQVWLSDEDCDLSLPWTVNNEPFKHNSEEASEDTFNCSESFNNDVPEQQNISLGEGAFIGQDTMQIINQWDTKRDDIVKSVERLIRSLETGYHNDIKPLKEIQRSKPESYDIQYLETMIKDIEAQKQSLNFSNLYKDLDAIAVRKNEAIETKISNSAYSVSVLTTELRPKLNEILQHLDKLKDNLAFLEDSSKRNSQEKLENLNKTLEKHNINQIIDEIPKKIAELKSIKYKLNSNDLDLRLQLDDFVDPNVM